MNKQEFREHYPELARHRDIRGYLETSLTLPEIQAQIKRGFPHDCGSAIYQYFLDVTHAPEGIENRYKGERCTRIYESYERIQLLLRYKPAYIRGGVAYLRPETKDTCIAWGGSIDSDLASWLESQMTTRGHVVRWSTRENIQFEYTWESEIGIIPEVPLGED